MNTFFPTWPVDGPPPLPQRYGLLQAAEAQDPAVRILTDTYDGPIDLDGLPARDVLPQAGRERWLSGVQVWPYPPSVPEVWDGCGTGSPGPGTKGFGETVAPPEFAPVTLFLPITCTAQQVPDQAAFKARAARALSAKASYAVALELMTGGLFGSQPYFADGEGTFPNDDVATGVNHGFQLLEQAIAATGSMGVIHCSPMLVTAVMGSGYYLQAVNGVIQTITGVPVIPDFGYAGGATPVGHTSPGPTEEWAYATGPIDIRRTELFTTPDTLTEALDRGSGMDGATNNRPNTITYFAEQYFLADWDTALQAAVLIDRCSSECNVAS